MNEPTKTKICSVCGCDYFGFGANAWPVNTGRCCFHCDQAIVIPHRMRNVQRSRGAYSEQEWYAELVKEIQTKMLGGETES